MIQQIKRGEAGEGRYTIPASNAFGLPYPVG